MYIYYKVIEMLHTLIYINYEVWKYYVIGIFINKLAIIDKGHAKFS